jgi:hypothetical protein
MLDFNNVLATPGADIQYFEGTSRGSLTQWEVWKKPRGAKWIHMIGVGGGGGGGTGINTDAGNASGGGASGSSGGQSVVQIPAMLVPDVLYIQAGQGGAGATVSGGNGSPGTITYVCISPYTTIAPAGTFLLATGGTSTTSSATNLAGGTAPGAVAVATIAGMCLAGRGFYRLLAGQVGVAGGAPNANGTNQTPPLTGLMVTGGASGGGTIASVPLGGNINTVASVSYFFPLPLFGGGSGSENLKVNGPSGFKSSNFLFNFGGTGGAGALTTAGGAAGSGGDGMPGCGGGGGGGANPLNSTIGKGGDGGPGFVYIITT